MNKKLLTFLLAAACAATCAVGISACGEGTQNENPGEIQPENTADIYVFSHAEAVGGSYTQADIDEIEAMYADVMFVFDKDGTVSLYLGGQPMEGTYTTAEDGTVTCALPIGNMSFTISDDSFSVEIAAYGDVAYIGTFVLDNDATIPAPPGEQADVIGTYYQILSSETGWQPYEDSALVLNDDNTYTMGGSLMGSYQLQDEVVIIEMQSQTFYFALDGNILWAYYNLEDVGDVNKAVDMFYTSLVLEESDRQLIVSLFGEGITGGELEPGDEEQPELTLGGYKPVLLDGQSGELQLTDTIIYNISSNGVINVVGGGTTMVGEYYLADGVLTISLNGATISALANGNIILLYASAEDVGVDGKAAQALYLGDTISAADEELLKAALTPAGGTTAPEEGGQQSSE